MEAVNHWRAIYVVEQGTTHIIGFMADHQRYRVTSPPEFHSRVPRNPQVVFRK